MMPIRKNETVVIDIAGNRCVVLSDVPAHVSKLQTSGFNQQGGSVDTADFRRCGPPASRENADGVQRTLFGRTRLESAGARRALPGKRSSHGALSFGIVGEARRVSYCRAWLDAGRRRPRAMLGPRLPGILVMSRRSGEDSRRPTLCIGYLAQSRLADTGATTHVRSPARYISLSYHRLTPCRLSPRPKCR